MIMLGVQRNTTYRFYYRSRAHSWIQLDSYIEVPGVLPWEAMVLARRTRMHAEKLTLKSSSCPRAHVTPNYLCSTPKVRYGREKRDNVSERTPFSSVKEITSVHFLPFRSRPD